jgi:RHS repeat-associated protein
MIKRHPDYLSHNELITDRSGNPYQYFHYTAWGESFAQAEATHQGSFSSSYRFNAKELDVETGNYYYGARYYHPKWSVWLSVDRLASKGPGFTPYSFCHNNPIMLVDPDGNWPYAVTIRSFHPDESFGKGAWYAPIGLGRNFSGDNRGFQLWNGSSSRISHTLTADSQKGTIDYQGRNGGTYSDDSHHPWYGTDQDQPDGYVGDITRGENTISFLTGYSGTNPLAPGPTPDIDVDAMLSISQNQDILSICGQVAGDDFPNTEAFMTDPSGNKLFIGTDVRMGGNDQNPLILFGPATELIMTIDMQVRINPGNGNFEAVRVGNEWMDINTWNQQFFDQDPNP